MLIALLACHSPDTEARAESGDSLDTDTLDAGDTGQETDTADTSDTGPKGGLDVCVVNATPLVRRWSASMLDDGAAFDRITWRDGKFAGIADGWDIVVADMPADGGEPSLLRLEHFLYQNWHDLLLTASGTLVVAESGGVSTWNVADGAPGAAISADNSDWLRSIAPSREGVRFTSVDFTAAMDLSAGTSTRLTVPLDRVSVVGGDEHASWVVGEVDGVIATSVDVGRGYGEILPIPNVFGDAVGALSLPDGGALIAGGPEGYGWLARFDVYHSLVATTQFESPGMPRLVGSAASRFGWSFFAGMGAFATDPDELGYTFMTDGTDLVDLFVSPDGNFLLTAHADGTVQRWECESD